jgi:hypothetical protein
LNGSLLVNIDPIQCDYDSPESIEEEGMDHFIVTDAIGKKQDLYVANLDLNPSLEGIDLSMPPPLPEIGFDARFAQGEYIKPVSPDSGVVELVINIEAQAYPVNVSWELNPVNGIEYSIVTEGLGKESSGASINQSGSTTILSSSNGKFRLNAQATGNINKDIPVIYSLSQNYPNPFNPVTTIKYDIANIQDVKLTIYDILGREITTLVDKKQEPGSYQVNWDASNYTSGIYFYTLATNNFNQTKKLILLK